MELSDSRTNVEPTIDEDLRVACDSDELANILAVVNGDKDKLQNVVGYLSEKDNISMKIRVLALPWCERNALMIYLMTLEAKDAPKFNRVCKDGLNPIHHFSAFEGLSIFIRLLAHIGADLDAIGDKGQTPLVVACERGNSEAVTMLINNGAKAYDKLDESGWAPLHYACQLGNRVMVEALIKAGANVNIMSTDKLMPIHLAISTAQAARMSPTCANGIPWSVEDAAMCIYLLANNGADMNYVCPYGFSALSFMKMAGAVK